MIVGATFFINSVGTTHYGLKVLQIEGVKLCAVQCACFIKDKWLHWTTLFLVRGGRGGGVI